MKRKIFLLLVVLMLILTLAGCKNKGAVSPTVADTPTATPQQLDTFVVETQAEEPTEEPTEKEDKVTIRENETVNRSERETQSRSERPTQTPTSAPAKASQSNKVWHNAVYRAVEHPAETKDVWIVDKEAYTYEKPIYGFKDITICDICSQELTGSQPEHQQLHNGEATFHTENRYVLVGTETVEVAEQGHYETVVIKEAYIEYVLVKEAGYY